MSGMALLCTAGEKPTECLDSDGSEAEGVLAACCRALRPCSQPVWRRAESPQAQWGVGATGEGGGVFRAGDREWEAAWVRLVGACPWSLPQSGCVCGSLLWHAPPSPPLHPTSRGSVVGRALCSLCPPPPPPVQASAATVCQQL